MLKCIGMFFQTIDISLSVDLPAAILLCFKGSPLIILGAETSKKGSSVG
jgi:hypothetical protein